MIKEFQNEYRWLSNFVPVEINFKGRSFSSVEHGYMSEKSNDLEWKEFCSDPSNHPVKVKRKSKKIVLRDDWDFIKVEVMRELLVLKFSQNPFKELLLNTGNLYIQEGNKWGDTFWGVDLKTNVGENNLGKLIMSIREDLKREASNKKPYKRLLNRITGFISRLLRLALQLHNFHLYPSLKNFYLIRLFSYHCRGINFDLRYNF